MSAIRLPHNAFVPMSEKGTELWVRWNTDQLQYHNLPLFKRNCPLCGKPNMSGVPGTRYLHDQCLVQFQRDDTANISQDRDEQPTEEPVAYFRDHSLQSKLVMAARTLPTVFTFIDLVVGAWKFDQESFGLKGFSTLYPDSNKVAVLLSVRSSCIRRGYMIRTAPNTFQLTPLGRTVQLVR